MKNTPEKIINTTLEPIIPQVLIGLVLMYFNGKSREAEILLETYNISELKRYIHFSITDPNGHWYRCSDWALSVMNTLVTILTAIAQEQPYLLARGKDKWYGPVNQLQNVNFFREEAKYLDPVEALQDFMFTKRMQSISLDIEFIFNAMIREYIKDYQEELTPGMFDRANHFFLALCSLADIKPTNITPLVRAALQSDLKAKALPWKKTPSRTIWSPSEYEPAVARNYQYNYAHLFNCRILTLSSDAKNVYTTLLDPKNKQKLDSSVTTQLPAAIPKTLLAECKQFIKRSAQPEAVSACEALVKDIARLTFSDAENIQEAFKIIAAYRTPELNRGDFKLCLDQLEDILKEAQHLLSPSVTKLSAS